MNTKVNTLQLFELGPITSLRTI